jgi:hypothetical protein
MTSSSFKGFLNDIQTGGRILYESQSVSRSYPTREKHGETTIIKVKCKTIIPALTLGLMPQMMQHS